MKNDYLVGVAILLGVTSTSWSQDFEKYQKSLTDAMPPAAATTPTVSPTIPAPAPLSNLQQVQFAASQNNYTQAIQLAQSFGSFASTKKEKRIWEDILSDLKTSQIKHTQELQKNADKLLKQVAEGALKAKTPDEITKLIQQIQDFEAKSIRSMYSDSIALSINSKLGRAKNFLNQYSRYLSAKEENEIGSQLIVLNDLIRNRSYYGLITTTELKSLRKKLIETIRSTVEERLAPIRKEIGEAKSRADFDVIEDQLNTLSNDYSNANLNNLRNEISQMNRSVEMAGRIVYRREQGRYSLMLKDIRSLRDNSSANIQILPKGWLNEQAQYALNQMPTSYANDIANATKQIEEWRGDKKIAGNLNTLSRLVEGYGNSNMAGLARNDLHQFRSSLNRILRIESATDGNSSYSFDTAARWQPSELHPWGSIVDEYYQAALIQGVVNLYGLIDFPKKIKKDERASDALRRIAEDAAAAQQWDECYAYLQIVHNATQTCRGRSDFENLWNALTHYRAARLLEEAGESHLAIKAYQKVLSIPGQDLPRQESIDAIAKLRAEIQPN